MADLKNNSTCGQVGMMGRYQDSPNAVENSAWGRWLHLAERAGVQTGKESSQT